MPSKSFFTARYDDASHVQCPRTDEALGIIVCGITLRAVFLSREISQRKSPCLVHPCKRVIPRFGFAGVLRQAVQVAGYEAGRVLIPPFAYKSMNRTRVIVYPILRTATSRFQLAAPKLVGSKHQPFPLADKRNIPLQGSLKMKMVGRRSPAFRPVIKQRIAFRKMFVHPLQEPSRKLPVGLVGKHLRLVAHGRQGKMFRQDGVRIYAEREPLVNPDADACFVLPVCFPRKESTGAPRWKPCRAWRR